MKEELTEQKIEGLKIILNQFLQTKDINQVIEDIKMIIKEGK